MFLRPYSAVGRNNPALPKMFVRWYDTFDTARSAGNVLNTYAEPGPEYRVGVDATNLWTISNGKLHVTSSRNLYTDPVLRYTPLSARYFSNLPDAEKSKRLFVAFTVAFHSGPYAGPLGWLRHDSPVENRGSVYYDGTFLCMGTGEPVARITPDVEYNIVLIIRNGGGYHVFLQGGSEFPNWCLVGVTRTSGVTGAPTAGFACYNGSYSISYISQGLCSTLLPYMYCAHNFTATNGSPLGISFGADNDMYYNNTYRGRQLEWTDRAGVWGVSSNSAKPTSLDSEMGLAISTITADDPDNFFEVSLTRSSGTLGMVFRYHDNSNFCRLEMDGTNMKVIRRVSGVDQSPDFSVAQAVGTLRMGMIGSELFGWGTVQSGITTPPVISTPEQSNIYGIFSNNVGNKIDNFAMYTRYNWLYDSCKACFKQ